MLLREAFKKKSVDFFNTRGGSGPGGQGGVETIAEMTGFLLNKSWIYFYKGDHEVNGLPELKLYQLMHH